MTLCMTAAIVVSLAGCGGNLIIYVAALAGIDRSIIETALLDGASGLKKFWYITVSSIKFPLAYTIVVSIVVQFNIYGQPLILTGGRSGESTFVLLMYIRNLVSLWQVWQALCPSAWV